MNQALQHTVNIDGLSFGNTSWSNSDGLPDAGIISESDGSQNMVGTAYILTSNHAPYKTKNPRGGPDKTVVERRESRKAGVPAPNFPRNVWTKVHTTIVVWTSVHTIVISENDNSH